jgi:hypothetical protein
VTLVVEDDGIKVANNFKRLDDDDDDDVCSTKHLLCLL